MGRGAFDEMDERLKEAVRRRTRKGGGGGSLVRSAYSSSAVLSSAAVRWHGLPGFTSRFPLSLLWTHMVPHTHTHTHLANPRRGT